jgi:hypothetical protein
MNVVDNLVKFAVENIGWDSLSDAGFREEETLKQYLAYQFIHENLMMTVDPESNEITGILIAYECDEEEAYKAFSWEEPLGKSCIFVAQVATKDHDSAKLLAYGFLQRFKDKKTTIGVRRGSYTTMKAHDIAQRMTSNMETHN